MNKKAYVLIDVEKCEAGCVVAELAGKPGISAADVVLGPHDVVVVIEAEDVDGIERVVRDVIANAAHVARTQTMLAIS